MEPLSAAGIEDSGFEGPFEMVLPVLTRAARELCADAGALLLVGTSRIEVTYVRSQPGHQWSRAIFEIANREQFEVKAGPLDAGNPLAELLRERVVPYCRAFVLFPCRVRQQTVAVVFGFSGPAPCDPQLPESLREKLGLIGWAAWSAKEIVRLHAELKTVTHRLAGRKLVERAKGLLQLEQGLSEEMAYEYLRGQSRRRRITLAALAEEIVRERAGRNPLSLAAS